MALDNIKFSVIVPFYNVEKYIEKCIRSLLEQTYENYEIILVDDGSIDASSDIAKEFVKVNEKIRMITQENKGLGGARNTGVRYAEGDYIVFIDSDDYVKSIFLEKIAYLLAQNDCPDILCYNIIEVDEEGKTLRFLDMNEGLEGRTNVQETPRLLAINPSACNKVYRKDFYLSSNVMFPEKTLYEDTAAVRKLLVSAESIYFTKNHFYYYVQHSSSITHRKPSPRCLDIIKVMDDLSSYFKEKNIFEPYAEELGLIAIRSVLLFALEKVNEVDWRYTLQNELVDYIEKTYPDILANKYLSKDLQKRIAVLLKRKFRRYHFRYVKSDQWKRKIKRMLKR